MLMFTNTISSRNPISSPFPKIRHIFLNSLNMGILLLYIKDKLIRLALLLLLNNIKKGVPLYIILINICFPFYGFPSLILINKMVINKYCYRV